ncbi:hypothetical protein FA15DRAFT_648036 [Coprinopsis marcescibilis]|uniref:Transmembrane protein n=1 Tax=Coprinopsis marcescibilis TaxID=230819 RepID=A0A5C3KHY5_COPMA|nr:hypothetical protein FA15DRAFT_648036 [Coprinopsis marcescibilis]
MPSFMSSFEDTSPFFFYNGIWTAGSSSDDPLTERYSESSYMATSQEGASLSFRFHGSSVNLFGSKRASHGTFQVNIDGQIYPLGDGRPSSTSEEFNATLFTASMGQTSHNVELVTRDDRRFDVDTISWETAIGEPDEPLIVNTIQDSHPDFVYEPANAWSTRPPGVESFSGRSGQCVFQPQGAAARLAFRGDTIAVFGPVGPNCATYLAQVNGSDPRRFSALKSVSRQRQLLFWAGGLGAGSHDLELRMDSSNANNQIFSIDYVEVYTTPSLGGSFDGLPVAIVPNQTANPVTVVPVGFIVGLALVSVVAGLALIALVIIFIMNRRRKRLHQQYDSATHEAQIPSPATLTASPFIQRAGNYSNSNIASPHTGTGTTPSDTTSGQTNVSNGNITYHKSRDLVATPPPTTSTSSANMTTPSGQSARFSDVPPPAYNPV